jgi:oligopeptide transport system substrate-binding protein
MKKKWMQKFLAALIAVSMVLAVAPSAFAEEVPGNTWLRSMRNSPGNWSPHTWQMSHEGELLGFLETPLTARIMGEDRINYELKLMSARSVTDITASYEDKEKWGIPADADWGYVWEIVLRDDLKWCDGTPINAQTHVYSMQMLLDPEFRNSRAGGVFNASYTMPGAVEFFNGEGSWEDVGYYMTDDYTIIWVCQMPNSEWDFLYGASSILTVLVHQETYEANIEVIEDFKSSRYGTSVETSRSHGAFKLVYFEAERQFILDRNENWFGWNDPMYEGWYPQTRIIYDIVPQQTTQLMLFELGMLDEVIITADDMVRFRFSDYLMRTPQSFTMRWIFATSLESLISLEDEAGDGANKRVLHYRDFRRGISLMMDRATFTAQATAAFTPAIFLFNDLYYYNISEDPTSIYRRTPEAMGAVLQLYGVTYGEGEIFETLEDAYYAITGYDVLAAREAFQMAYEQAIADGNYTDGQRIVINTMLHGSGVLTTDDSRQNELMNEFVAEATIGTGFEGMITFNFQSGNTQRYDDVALGRLEMIRGAWGGEFFRPFYMIGVYTDPDIVGGLMYIHESNGWDPTTDYLEVTTDFGDGVETRAKTFTEWYRAINPGGQYAVDANLSMRIFAQMEAGVLDTYQTIPVAVHTESWLRSMKVEFGAPQFNVIFGWGGDHFMTWNMNDAEWDAFIVQSGRRLNFE